MADFNFVTDRLATGAAITSADDVEALVRAGVTHVIDCIAGGDDAKLLSSHPVLVYLYNGTEDDGQPKPTSWFQASLEFALPTLAKPGAKVYAHCAAGVNRGPSTAYAIMRAMGIGAGTAEVMIRLARPQVGLRYKKDAEAAVLALGY